MGCGASKEIDPYEENGATRCREVPPPYTEKPRQPQMQVRAPQQVYAPSCRPPQQAYAPPCRPAAPPRYESHKKPQQAYKPPVFRAESCASMRTEHVPPFQIIDDLPTRVGDGAGKKAQFVRAAHKKDAQSAAIQIEATKQAYNGKVPSRCAPAPQLCSFHLQKGGYEDFSPDQAQYAVSRKKTQRKRPGRSDFDDLFSPEQARHALS